jgi:hypothetical protein
MDIANKNAARLQGLHKDSQKYLVSSTEIKHRGTNYHVYSDSEHRFNQRVTTLTNRQTKPERTVKFDHEYKNAHRNRDMNYKTSSTSPSNNAPSHNRRYSSFDYNTEGQDNQKKYFYDEDYYAEGETTPMWNKDEQNLRDSQKFSSKFGVAQIDLSQTLTPYARNYLNDKTMATAHDVSISEFQNTNFGSKNNSLFKTYRDTPNSKAQADINGLRASSLKRQSNFESPSSSKITNLLRSRLSTEEKHSRSKFKNKAHVTLTSNDRVNLFSSSSK